MKKLLLLLNQSEMVKTPYLSDILKAITGLGSRMNNLQDQINALSQCDPAVPEQNEDLMVGDHNEEAGGVSVPLGLCWVSTEL